MQTLEELLKNDMMHEELLERLAIVEHKMKFMEKVRLSVVDTRGIAQIELSEIAAKAGALLTTDVFQAHFIILYEQGKGIADLIAMAPSILDTDWPASASRVALMADCYQLDNAEDKVSMIEDIAEILHQGQFVFGYEGDKWIRFSLGY